MAKILDTVVDYTDASSVRDEAIDARWFEDVEDVEGAADGLLMGC